MEYSLTPSQKKRLIEIARQSVESVVRGASPPGLTPQDDEALGAPGAAFVTLKRGGQLRGCIGQVEARLPLWRCVREMAQAAALQDPRFVPVDPGELAELDYEISVLFPMQRVENVEEIVVGRDGLMIEKGGRRGLLLPQVPVEWGWDRETFLDQTARKAGLPAHAWREGATIYRFQGIIFSDAPSGEEG